MYVATIPNRGSPPALLLREGYREGRQVKTRTLANLTHWPAARVEALRRCLKGEFDAVGTTSEPVSDRIFAVLFVLKEVAQRLGITSLTRTDYGLALTLGGLALGQTVLSKAVLASGQDWNSDEAHSAVYDTEQTADLFCAIVNQWQQFVDAAPTAVTPSPSPASTEPDDALSAVLDAEEET